MPERFNQIRNADYSEGVKRPRGWTWSADLASVTAESVEADDGASRDIVITSEDEQASGFYTQRVRCKAEHWYRIEAVMTCACETAIDDGGAMLCVRPLIEGEETGPVRLAVVTRSVGPETLRGYYRVPEGAKAFEVGVGVAGATGEVRLHSALVIPNIEPDVASNPLALPPPPYTYAAPRKVRRICVCDDKAENRPLVAMLRTRFRKALVEHHRTDQLPLSTLQADALIVAGSKPPAGMRSLSALEREGANRLVIVSLEAFAKIVGGDLKVRAVDQPDDPIHAKVVWANFITRGFALRDAIPWTSPSSDRRVFRQRHIRRGATVTRLRKTHGYETILESETDSDSTSDHPICLYKEIAGGGVVILDTDAVETLPTTQDETGLAALMLLNMLGVDQAAVGQYTVPVDTENAWYRLLREFAERYAAVRLSGADRCDMMLEVGASQETFGLSPAPRPVLLIRTGLTGDDFAGMYGCMTYLKHLVRNAPYETPFARDLLGGFRLAWVPLCAPYGVASSHEAAGAMTGEFQSGSIAAVVDVTDTSRRSLRIAYGASNAAYKRHADLLPQLAECFAAGRFFYRAVDDGEALSRRDTLRWRQENLLPTVELDPESFDSEFHRAAADAGANLIRVEIPGSSRDFICNSIWRTDQVASTLEHVIGAHYGILAANRTANRVVFDGHPPLAPGQGVAQRGNDHLNKHAG